MTGETDARSSGSSGALLIIDYINREFVRSHPDWLFVFGDNLLRTGYGGQAAAMRGEPNAVGVPTKKRPAMTEDAFFTDAEYEANRAAIDAALAAVAQALRAGRTVVLPAAGLGTGRAQLAERAPRTFAYLQQRLASLRT